MEESSDAKIEDISTEFSKRCAEQVVEKIFLQPLKIWETVRDKMVAKLPHGVVVPTSEQVSLVKNN